MKNNMGAMSKKGMERFARFVLRDFPQWQMKWTTSGSICMRQARIVYIDKRFIGKCVWRAKEHFLHEVAHINTTNDHLHGIVFYGEFIRLLQIFMVK